MGDRTQTLPTRPAKKPKFGSSLIDYTVDLKRFVQTLSVDIDCIALEEPDPSMSRVEVVGPFGENDSFSLAVSQADIDNFERYASTVLIYSPIDEESHALILTRNSKTKEYELYDPNGSLYDTYPRHALHLKKAVHLGLLRPLIAPDVKSPLNPFSLSFQSSPSGLQNVEKDQTDDIIYDVRADMYNRLLGREAKDKLIEYLEAADGFCYTWAVFKVVDCATAQGSSHGFYSLFEEAYLTQGQRFRLTIEGFVNRLWLERFIAELLETPAGIHEVARQQAKALLKRLALPLFVRLLAAFFLRKREKGLDLQSAHDWWPELGSSGIDNIHAIVKCVSPDTKLLDWKRKFEDFTDIGLTYFPFRTIKNFKDDPLCKFIVHTKNGAQASDPMQPGIV